MPVDTLHPTYRDWSKRWRRCRDFAGGEDPVKETAAVSIQGGSLPINASNLAGTLYLPKIGGQTDADYQAYKQRAEVTGVTGRTLDGLVGAVFRKDPDVLLPQSVAHLAENADNAGTPLGLFAKMTLADVLLIGRYGVLVDVVPQASGASRPYFAGYAAEAIRNWRVDVIDAKPTLTRVILEEMVIEDDPRDEFGGLERTQLRVLELDENMRYRVRFFRPVVDNEGHEDKSRWVQLADVPQPSVRGEPLREIPFTFIGPRTLDAAIQKPPLLDLVNVNWHHYLLSAELNNVLFVSSVPQPVIVGDIQSAGPEPKEYRIGSTIAWTLPPNASATFLETTGGGRSGIAEEMAKDEARMVVLGARLLEPQKREAETAEALRLRQAGEQATLSSVADTVSWGMSRAIGWASMWAGESGAKFEFALNQDFTEARMEASEALMFHQIRNGGDLTEEDLFHLYGRGELLEPGITFEAWQAKRRLQAPTNLPFEAAA